MKMKKIITIMIIALLAVSITACTSAEGLGSITETLAETHTGTESSIESDLPLTYSTLSIEGSIIDASDLFTERDLEQTADLSEAVYIEMESNFDISVENEGVYVITGIVENTSIIVEVGDEEKVQLVFEDVSITNEDSPAIYIKSGDKIFLNLTGSNVMMVTGAFEADGETNLDAVIFSKSDIVLNGTGSLELVSSQGNGITSKDDLKITGGTYVIGASLDALEANDSIRIYDGDFTIITYKDALHSENEEDNTLGYIYIAGGTFNIAAADDAIRATTFVRIDSGTINIETCSEGIEGTYVEINGGDITIYATDDGINATAKSGYDVVIEVNGGAIEVSMASGDTDGFDSNGSIYINGGTIDVTANSAFDADRTAELNDGIVIVNGQQIDQITVTAMGGVRKR